jgi:hypothetical protein
MKWICRRLIIFLLLLPPALIQAQTDVSLFFKKGDQKQIEFVESASGNLYNKLGHHGPAIENPWYGLRLYFSKKTAIDVYSKARAGLELKDKQWYPSKKEQVEGWGADYYKVGNTVGLGGVKLWDKSKLVDLHPVIRRSARVTHNGDSASMEMISEGVIYKGEQVDISVQVTVYAGRRDAKVRVSCISGHKVQFVTGINYFNKLKVVKTEDYIATWGIHPEDVAAEKVEVGAAVFIPTGEYIDIQKLKNQYILISEPVRSMEYTITSANVREEGINSMEDFIDLLMLP